VDVFEFSSPWGFRCPERKGVADFLQEVRTVHHISMYVYIKFMLTNSIEMLSR
jgi:hypothetical protein